jgi:hypothetical protein
LDEAVPAKPAPSTKPPKTAGLGPLRGRIQQAIEDTFRESGLPMTLEDVAKALTKKGVPFVDGMIADRLRDAVKRGDLMRWGDNYQPVRFDMVKR